MRIAIDAMGGDHAPDEIIAGAVEAAPLLDKDDVLILIGPKDLVASKLSEKNTHKYKCIEVIDAETVIGMDEKPVEAIRSKKRNSIDVMARMGASGEVDAVISAGNTGACVAAFQMRMRNLPGVNRPGISVVFPTFEGPLTLCDVGANINCKPIHLYQYAVMASLYSHHTFGIENPRIGIMSIGEEDAKGNETIKKARELLRSDKNLNFAGNVEGRDIFSGKCDVIITDGYVGNVVLKLSEALVSYMFKSIKKELIENHKIMALAVGHVMKQIYKKYDYHEYGGAPLLGINGTAMICHGSSKARTIRSAILAARKYHREHINAHIIEYLSKSDVRSVDDSPKSVFNPIIAGTGSYLPKKTLTNADLSLIVETNDEWITTRTGIKTRRIAADNESTATLATEAAKNAIADAGITPEQVDMIIVATITPEMVFPSTACFVQNAIGAKNAWAFDISAACSGFVYGLSIAEQFIKAGKYENILVIGAETLSKITNYKDRTSCILFGDGSGAAIVQRSTGKSRGIIYSKTISDGSGWGALKCEAYGSRNPVSRELENPDMVYMNINGREVYQLAVRNIVDTVNECVAACNLTISDLDLFIPHQMNARIIESSAKRLELDNDKVFINIEKYGNTSAASIPIAMDEAKRQGRIKSGDIVILVAFGGGLTWGANVIEF